MSDLDFIKDDEALGKRLDKAFALGERQFKGEKKTIAVNSCLPIFAIFEVKREGVMPSVDSPRGRLTGGVSFIHTVCRLLYEVLR